MNKDEALRLALEALEYPGPSWLEARQPAITAIKQALEETPRVSPEPEPVKVMGFDCVCGRRMVVESDNGIVASPPKREPLTDGEIKKICEENKWDSSWQSLRFARAIEAAHGIKVEA